MDTYLVAFFVIFTVLGVSGQQVFTCETRGIWCLCNNITIDKNDNASFNIDFANPNSTIYTIDVLNFESSSIYFIPSEIVSKFPNLGSVRIVNQGLHEIRPNTFLNSGNLDEIWLFNNTGLTRLDDDTFAGAVNLLVLEINSCSINTVGPNAFRGI
jgi:hypothetical protein